MPNSDNWQYLTKPYEKFYKQATRQLKKPNI